LTRRARKHRTPVPMVDARVAGVEGYTERWDFKVGLVGTLAH
jgi:hypothetical protein